VGAASLAGSVGRWGGSARATASGVGAAWDGQAHRYPSELRECPLTRPVEDLARSVESGEVLDCRVRALGFVRGGRARLIETVGRRGVSLVVAPRAHVGGHLR
jgi:hypothetical protein